MSILIDKPKNLHNRNMSYNISTFHLKTLENLRVTINLFWDRDIYSKLELDKSWIPEKEFSEDNRCLLINLGEGEMIGSQTDEYGIILVESISIFGEGSGHMSMVLKEILSKSKGRLEAVLVWEGGDSITRLTVVDGAVTETKVEL